MLYWHLLIFFPFHLLIYLLSYVFFFSCPLQPTDFMLELSSFLPALSSRILQEGLPLVFMTLGLLTLFMLVILYCFPSFYF